MKILGASPRMMEGVGERGSIVRLIVDGHLSGPKPDADLLPSNPLHKPIQHALLPGAVEFDRQLVALDLGDIAVAEFDVEDAVADGEF